MKKKIGSSIMCEGWTNKKRRCICNFLVNSPKWTIFFCHQWILLICPRLLIRYLMLDAIVERIEEENVVQIVTDNAANYKVAG
jgi:hypothetical protein